MTAKRWTRDCVRLGPGVSPQERGAWLPVRKQSRGSVSRAEPGGDRMLHVREATSSLKDPYQRPEEEVILSALGSDTLMAILAE